MAKAEMIRAYTETLLEQLIGVDKVRPDDDGDYPVRYNSALYYVRIVDRRPDNPVVQVFAIALAGVEPGGELYEALNGLNVQLNFARAFYVNHQVLIESEIPGDGLSAASFALSAEAVARAADRFGVELQGRFGGHTAFEDEKHPEYEPPATSAGYL
jgi:hypothetical protein